MRLWLSPGGDVVALVCAAQGESLVVVIPPTLDPIALALARAALGPLAIERAPATRVNALLPAATADPAAIEAAIAFLEGAPSTTGQLLEIS